MEFLNKLFGRNSTEGPAAGYDANGNKIVSPQASSDSMSFKQAWEQSKATGAVDLGYSTTPEAPAAQVQARQQALEQTPDPGLVAPNATEAAAAIDQRQQQIMAENAATAPEVTPEAIPVAEPAPEVADQSPIASFAPEGIPHAQPTSEQAPLDQPAPTAEVASQPTSETTPEAIPQPVAPEVLNDVAEQVAANLQTTGEGVEVLPADTQAQSESDQTAQPQQSNAA